MNFFDDIKTRLSQEVEKAGQKAKQDINSYISNNITEPLVKVGKAATGNLSEADIKAGKKAASPSPIIANAPVAVKAGLSVGMLALIGVGAYFLFFSKKSRG